MITGITQYNQKRCVFKLNGFNLELEEIENSDKIYIDEFDAIFNSGIIKYPNELWGQVLEGGYNIRFFIRRLDKTNLRSHSFILNSYHIYNDSEFEFDAISVYCDELDWFYNIQAAYKYNYNSSTGECDVKLIPYDNLKKQFSFRLNSKTVKCSLNNYRCIHYMSTTPIELRTVLSLNSNEIIDKKELNNWINIIYSFLTFISYRKNISIDKIKLKKKNGDSYKIIGEAYYNKIISGYKETKNDVQKKIIRLPLIENKLGDIFEMIANGKIYLTHIPDDSNDRRMITAGRFVTITAGFEWQFKISFKKNDENKDKFVQERKEIIDFLEEKKKSVNSKKKKFYNRFIKIINNTNLNLSNKILIVLKKYDDVLNDFIKNLYNMNNLEVDYNKIAERIQKQRNDYAHGNIDKELNKVVLLDLMVLEWVYYVMILQNIGISKNNIRHIINELFSRNRLIS